MNSRVSEKGQVTIPKRLRDSLGLEAGTELVFGERDGMLIAKKVPAVSSLLQLVGILPPMDVDEYLEQSRGPAWQADLDGERP